MSLRSEPPASRAARWLGVFAYRDFALIWLASTLALVGVAMYDTASGWMIMRLDPDPRMVSALRAAINLPMFLVTLAAGAIADIVDARRLLMFTALAAAIFTAGFAALASLQAETSALLLTTTFLLSAMLSLNSPAWLAIVPRQVPREEISGAMAANGVGYNVSKAMGPAVGGFAIHQYGVSAPIWFLAAANLLVFAALLMWRPPTIATSSLPAERLTSAVSTGLRHAFNNRLLRATLVHAVAIFPFAAAYWGLLPLISGRADATPGFYGILLSALSVGTIIGSFMQGRLREHLDDDALVVLGSVATAAALAMYALFPTRAATVGASLVAGAGWVLILIGHYSSAEHALPDWVRARGLAVFLTIVFGSVTVGAYGWGYVAGWLGLDRALLLSAAGALLAIPAVWTWKLARSESVDLTPSLHWRVPQSAQPVENSRGPVLVKLEYRIDPAEREKFLRTVDEMGMERKRDGAFAWGIFEDASHAGRFEETYLIGTWLELLHLRERITVADRMLEEEVGRMLLAPPKIEYLIFSEKRAGPFHPHVRV